MNRRLTILTALTALTLTTLAQEVPAPRFASPFDFPLYLSGNFGELRSGHFHGGVDFKTQDTTDHPIHCIADGYISRVSVSNGGYGNGMYITHRNGFTSVYGHLNAFLPQIAERIRQYQYEHETYVCDLTFGPGEYPVTEGEIVAMSGNTGYSFGPHLHMELRQTDTDEPVDPLAFYRNRIPDDVPPTASALMVYADEGLGTVACSTQQPAEYGSRKAVVAIRNGSVQGGAAPFTVWGRIGCAIAAYDYMTATHNFYGVRSVRLYVDDRLVSESTVDRFSFDENRMLDSWIDYEERLATGRWFMRSTVAERNTLRMLHTGRERGWITVDEERDYRCRYELRDIYGNLQTVRFTLRGQRQEQEQPLKNYFYHLEAGKAHAVSWKNLTLWLPEDALYDDLQLSSRTATGDGEGGPTELVSRVTPLKEDAELRMALPASAQGDKSKYYIAELFKGSALYRGGSYEYGWLKTTVSRLGTYVICADTMPPRILPKGEGSWSSTGTVVFGLTDEHTGIKSYRGTVDGEWKLFRFNSKDMKLWCDLRAEGVTAGHHVVEVTVTDMRDNVTTECFDILLP